MQPLVLLGILFLTVILVGSLLVAVYDAVFGAPGIDAGRRAAVAPRRERRRKASRDCQQAWLPLDQTR